MAACDSLPGQSRPAPRGSQRVRWWRIAPNRKGCMFTATHCTDRRREGVIPSLGRQVCLSLGEQPVGEGGIKGAEGGEMIGTADGRSVPAGEGTGGSLTLWRGVRLRKKAPGKFPFFPSPSPCLCTASRCFHKGEDLFFNNAKLAKVVIHHFLKSDSWGREVISDLIPCWTCVTGIVL